MKLTAPPPPSSVPNTTHSPPVRTRMEIFPEDFDLWLSSVLYFPPACVPLIRTVFFYSQPRPQLRACVHCFECLLPRLQNRPALKPKELHKGRSKRSLVSAQLPMLQCGLQLPGQSSQGRFWWSLASLPHLQRLLFQGPAETPGREARL